MSRSGPKLAKDVVSQEMPRPAPAVDAVPKPRLWLADREEEPWYADGVED